MSRKKSILLPSINYKQITSLVLLLLVTHTPLTSQTPLAQQLYDCPHACECNEQNFSAKCSDIDALINAYSLKHPTGKNFMPIKVLDLSNNQLTKISNQLELLVNLTELNLSHNRLTQVHKLHLEHLETLNLSHNRITSGKLSKLPKNVTNLDLANNEITYLPSDFMKLKKLRSLELSENPLNCTCETLMIRNWIQYKHVWTDKAIVCASPQIFKGQPWVQAKQNDICIESLSTTTQQSKYNWDDQDLNDVMLGDAPAADADDADNEDYSEGDYNAKPLNEHLYDYAEGGNKIKRTESSVTDTSAEKKDERSTSAEKDIDYDKTSTEEEQEEEGDDIFNHSQASPSSEPPQENSSKEQEDELTQENFLILASTTEQPIELSSPVIGDAEGDKKQEDDYDEEESSGASAPPINVENENEDESSGESGGGPIPVIFESSTLGIYKEEETTEAPLLTNVQKNKVDNTEEVPPAGIVDTQTSGDLKKAQIEDNTGTYILLAVIGTLLCSLIVFVAMKNRQEKRNSRRGYDVEKEGRNGGTELQDMDKRLLGKPIEKNGNGKHENSPLINNHDGKEEGFKPYKAPAITVDEPIQELPQKDKSQNSLYENNVPNGNGNAFEPIEPVHTTPSNGDVPKSPDSDEEVFHPATDNPETLNISPETPKRYSPIYSPVSPRSARYSPVYSPETGRVKIKLTETPKPKTPVVVTRSRSRAGDYVNTPNN